MSEIKLDEAKKYLKAMKANKAKYLTCDLLAKDVGIYPDIIAKVLSYFDPLINMDMDYDLRLIQPKLNDYVKEKESNKHSPKNKKQILISTKYKSVNDFVFNKYVVAGGLMDRSIELSTDDLKELKKIIINELKTKKKRR